MGKTSSLGIVSYQFTWIKPIKCTQTPIPAWGNTVNTENRKYHPYSSPRCQNWETLIQTEHCTLCCIRTVGTEKEMQNSFWWWISFFPALTESENRLWSKGEKKKLSLLQRSKGLWTGVELFMRLQGRWACPSPTARLWWIILAVHVASHLAAALWKPQGRQAVAQHNLFYAAF